MALRFGLWFIETGSIGKTLLFSKPQFKSETLVCLHNGDGTERDGAGVTNDLYNLPH